MPKQKDLSAKEKAIVDQYKEEINAIRKEKESLITYDNELAEEGGRNQRIIIHLLYQKNLTFQDWQIEAMKPKEMMKMRLEVLQKQEEMKLICEKMKELRMQAVLRTVALQEIEKEEKSIVHKLIGTFRVSEKMKQKEEMEKIVSAKERMKTTIKVLEQQLQAIKLAMQNENSFVTMAEMYQQVLDKLENEKGKNLWEFRKDCVLDILAEQRKICEWIFPDETEKILALKPKLENFNEEAEKKIIAVVGEIQHKIDEYALQNFDKVNELQNELHVIQETFQRLQAETPIVDSITARRELPKETMEQKEYLLERMKRVQLECRIFQNFLEGDLKEKLFSKIYEVKFQLLTFCMLVGDMNYFLASEGYPFSELSEEELQYYLAIVEKKIEKLFTKKTEYPKQYGRYIARVKKFFETDNPNGTMASNVLRNGVFLKFLVNIENPNFKDEDICVQNFIMDTKVYFYFDPYTVFSVEHSDKYTMLGLKRWMHFLTPKEALKIIEKNQKKFEIGNKPGWRRWGEDWLLKDDFEMLYALLALEFPKEEKKVFAFPEMAFVKRDSTFYDKEKRKGKKVIKVNPKDLEECTCLKIFTDDVLAIQELINKYPNITEVEIFGIGDQHIETDYLMPGGNMLKITHYLNQRKIMQMRKESFLRETWEYQIIVEEGIEEIPSEYFRQLFQSEKIYLPKSLKKINREAFFDSRLLEVHLQEGIEEIEDYAFQKTTLEEIEIPNSLKKVGRGVFDITPLKRFIFKGVSLEPEIFEALIDNREGCNEKEIVIKLPKNQNGKEGRMKFTISSDRMNGKSFQDLWKEIRIAYKKEMAARGLEV